MNRYILKNVFLGIAIGIIITSSLNILFNNKELTIGQIKNEALKHNLIVLEKEQLIEKKQQEPVNNNTNDKINVSDTDSNNDQIMANTIEIIIEKGTPSELIIQRLVDNGIVDDYEKFFQFLAKNKKHNKLSYGTFRFKKGMTYDEVLTILTTLK